MSKLTPGTAGFAAVLLMARPIITEISIQGSKRDLDNALN